MVECPECGAGADLTADGTYAHCASCNNIFEPGKEGSGEKGSGSGSGDRPDDSQVQPQSGGGGQRDKAEGTGTGTKKKEWKSGVQAQEWKD